MIDFRHTHRLNHVGYRILYLESLSIRQFPAIREVSRRIEFEITVGKDHAQAHTIFVELNRIGFLTLLIEVTYITLFIGNATVGTDISYREPWICRGIFLHGDLIGFAKTELLNLHLLMSQHIVVKIPHVLKSIGSFLGQGDRIVVVGPATVKSLAKRKVLGSLREPTQVVVLAIPHLLTSVEFIVATVI